MGCAVLVQGGAENVTSRWITLAHLLALAIAVTV